MSAAHQLIINMMAIHSKNPTREIHMLYHLKAGLHPGDLDRDDANLCDWDIYMREDRNSF